MIHIRVKAIKLLSEIYNIQVNTFTRCKNYEFCFRYLEFILEFLIYSDFGFLR